MKKIFNILVLVAFAAFSANAQSADQTTQPPETPKQGPKIEFEKLVHDYGQIEQHANGECEFKFKNTGTEPLVLTNVQASCGCTTPSWPREPIMPGQESIIKIRYDTGRLGHIGKAVTVYSNSIDNTERITLRLAGNVSAKQN